MVANTVFQKRKTARTIGILDNCVCTKNICLFKHANDNSWLETGSQHHIGLANGALTRIKIVRIENRQEILDFPTHSPEAV